MKKLWTSASLGTRLACLYAALLALLLAALGAFFHYETRDFLLASTATGVRAQAKPVIERWLGASEGGPEVERGARALSRDLTSRSTVALVFDARGELLAHGRNLPEEPPPVRAAPALIARALAGDNEVNAVVGDDHGAIATLVLLIPLRKAPGHPHVLGVTQLNTSLDEVSELLLRQRVAITLGVLIAIVLGALAGWWLTTSALAPLRRVIGACRRIAAGELRQRIEAPPQAGEVSQLASAFNEMSARLEASFSAQRRFIADAAHELRTPLAGVQASIEVLMRSLERDPPAARQLASNMYAEARRLGRLAEQLLDLSRMNEPIGLTRRAVELDRFMAQFARRAQLLAQGHPIRSEAGDGALLHIDGDLLTQALVNLVDNAARHSEPDGEVRLGWAATPQGARIWVADDGEGIAPADLPHVAEPFFRGDRSRSRRQGGAGLGLSLVKRIAEAHGGQLQVESTPGVGSCFTLLLPRAGADVREALPG